MLMEIRNSSSNATGFASKTAMPDLNVGEEDARDITAFLYTRAK